MIILKATNETLKLVTSSMADLDVTVFWADRTTTTFSPNSTPTKITTATSTTILAAPAASTQRQFKGAKIRNIHASSTNTITLKLDVGGTTYVQTSDIPLLAGETFVIDTEGTWNVYTASGIIKLTGVFTANRVMITDSTGQLTVSSITTTILNYIANLTSDAQTQIDAKQSLPDKDATGGYVGLTLFAINFKNALNTFTSFFTNSNTASRTYIFPDYDSTVATIAGVESFTNKTFTDDITITAGKLYKSSNSGRNSIDLDNSGNFNTVIVGQYSFQANAGFIFMSDNDNSGNGGFVYRNGGSSTNIVNITKTGDIIPIGFSYKSLTNAITASTTQTQVGGTILTTEYNRITTANNLDAVTFPTAVKGQPITVINDSGHTISMFPFSGDNLGTGVDTVLTLATGLIYKGICYDTTNWKTL